ncbi:Conserved hypothetical protein [Synechococcus sp. RCC307]|nr:Conserved hypothetical protein [Synechococcus sp. RCC307]
MITGNAVTSDGDEVEGGARSADPYYLQVCHEPDCAVMSVCPSWITQRLPRGPEPELRDLSRRR